MLLSTFVLSTLTAAASAALSDSSLEKHVDTLTLSASFNPIKDAYWTGYPHHRRTPFAVSPDGKTAWLAYLDSSDTDVHVQQVDPSTFAAVGTPTTVTGGKEAGGLVAHNDGFALLTNEALPSGTTNAPPSDTPVPVLYRYTSGKQTFKTFLAGPGVHADEMLDEAVDMNGDLVYSEAAGLYGAYFVVSAYTTDYSGHYGDSIQYVKTDGTLDTITGASSSFGCSHNTGIAFEAADAAPFASICAEDQGDIWLNTKTQYMSGVKISNENTTNGASGEPMGGMSGSYSGLARFTDSDAYIFAWVSRGATDLVENSWMGSGYTTCTNRTSNRNVAIAQFTDKNTLVGPEASSTVGEKDGDSQVNWITNGTNDASNAHVAVFDGSNALVTWEEIENPDCPLVAFGCEGKFAGSFFQLVNNGTKVGEAVSATDVYVAGDMVTMSDGRICWPYVSMDWTLDGPVSNPASVTKISFACMNLDGSNSTTTTSSSAAVSSAVATSSAAASSVQQVDMTTAAAAATSEAAVASSAANSFVVFSSGQGTTPEAVTSSANPTFFGLTSTAAAEATSAVAVVSSAPASSAAASSALASSSVAVSSAVASPSSAAVSSAATSSAASSSAVVPSSAAAAPSVPAETPIYSSAAAIAESSSKPAFSAPSGFQTVPAYPIPSGYGSNVAPSGFGAAAPSGFASPSGHHGHQGHASKHHGHQGHGKGSAQPTGVAPSGYAAAEAFSGFALPTGFSVPGHLKQRPGPTGGYGGFGGFGATGFETKVKATPTPSAAADAEETNACASE